MWSLLSVSRRKKANNINLAKERLKTAGKKKSMNLKRVELQLVEEKEQQLQKLREKEWAALNQYREHLKQAKIESESNRKAVLISKPAVWKPDWTG